MTKTELLAALNTKFYKVFSPDPQQTYGNLKYYLVKVYDKVGDAIRDSNVAFYVEDEGMGTEVAYWSPSEPKPTITPSGFQIDLDAYIASRISDGTIEGAFIENSDIANKTAVVKVIMDSGGLMEKRLLIDKDTQDDLQYRVIT